MINASFFLLTNVIFGMSLIGCLTYEIVNLQIEENLVKLLKFHANEVTPDTDMVLITFDWDSLYK